jgi:hypothetical protein
MITSNNYTILSAKQITRFLSSIDKPGRFHCWEWSKSKSGFGYGQFNIMIKGIQFNFKAHRLAWELTNSQIIPADKIVMHNCDNPACCNPAHIHLGTTEENMQDMVNKDRQAKGIVNGMNIYTEKQVRDVKYKYAHKSALAIEYLTGVKRASIYKIQNRLQWTHI